MDVSVHFCCHKAPICHSAEQQKRYDENSLMDLKKLLKKISVPPVRTASLSVTMNGEINALTKYLRGIVLFSVSGKMTK